MPDARKISTLAVGTLLLLVTACGRSAARSDPGVATARTGPAATARPSDTSAVQRPLIRPDTSGDEGGALYNAYYGCLRDHGVPLGPQNDPKFLGKPAADLTTPQYKPAADACAAKQPEYWLDAEARTDPHYQDLKRAEEQCVRDKGIKADDSNGTGQSGGGTYDPQVGHMLEVVGECRKQVFHDVIDKFNAR